MSAKRTDVTEERRKRDPDLINAEIALKRAALKARRRAVQAGIGVIVVKDGRIMEEPHVAAPVVNAVTEGAALWCATART